MEFKINIDSLISNENIKSLEIDYDNMYPIKNARIFENTNDSDEITSVVLVGMGGSNCKSISAFINGEYDFTDETPYAACLDYLKTEVGSKDKVSLVVKITKKQYDKMVGRKDALDKIKTDSDKTASDL